MLNAGLPLLRALENVSKRGRLGKKFDLIRERVKQGDQIAESMKDLPSTFSDFDISIIKVGESSGNLPECFEHLADWYELLYKMKGIVKRGCVYPLFIFHFAAFVIPVPRIALTDAVMSDYPLMVIQVLSILYIPALIILCIYLFFPRTGLLRRVIDSITLRIPMIGKAVLFMNLSRFTRAFYISSKAGVPYIESLELSIRSINNQEVTCRLIGGIRSAKAGDPISSGFKHMPFDFLNLWQVGEETGDLDEVSGKLMDMYDYETERIMTAIAKTLPWILYLCVMGVMIYFIFKGVQMIYGPILNNPGTLY